MKNSQKGFIAPLLIAIIAILVVGGGTYIYIKRSSNPNTTITGNQTATSTIEVTLVIKPINGSFVGNDTWITTDTNGRKWNINYKDAEFFNSNGAIGQTQSDLNVWLKLAKEELTPGYEGPGPKMPIDVTGTIKGGIFHASQIVQHIQ
ncbi:MAG: hypothetical protein WCX27_00370 [Candidatus Paceibacterota bacterium]|jgi:hypothetical protein